MTYATTRTVPGLLALIVGCACAAGASDDTSAGLAFPVSMSGDFVSALLMDPETDEVLVAVDAHRRLEPASMVKMMTELLVLEAVGRGELRLDDAVTVSGRASKVGGSQVYLKEGEVFTVEELLMALAIHSANDAAAALGEHHSGTTEAFVDLMNLRAGELGMQETEFHSVHGLPPARGELPDLTSAYDMALLGREVIRYPEALRWGAMETAPFRNGEFQLHNPNRLVGKYRGLDGIKTGYHNEAGYCLTATAIQKEHRLIAVVMGASSAKGRAAEASRLLTYGFNLYSRQTLVDHTREQLDPLKVKHGKTRRVAVAYAESLTLSLRKDQVGSIVIEKRLADEVEAPVQTGQVVGKAVALLEGRELGEVPIVASEPVPEGSFFQKLFR